MRNGLKHPTVAVLGDGGWGTTLVLHLAKKGYPVRLWGVFADYVAFLDKKRENVKFLPTFKIPADIPILAQLEPALDKADVIVLAVPSQFLRHVARQIKPCLPREAVIVNVAKGLEKDTHLRMSEVIRQELGSVPVGVLSGPSIAYEVARGQPASVVIAADDVDLAESLQHVFLSSAFRVYVSTDCLGVELGGALKNPLAIAAGIADGLGLGANAKSALITRGMIEMARLGVALGAQPETFWGLSGLGDLLTTCLSGRNRALGEELGKGKRLADILNKTEMVIEGVDTSHAALALGAQHHVELPIVQQVHAILFEDKPPATAMQDLMARAPKHETVT